MNLSGLTPVGFCVLVELDALAEKTAGGVYLPPKVQDQDKLSVQEGTLVAVSPHAFNYVENWPDDTKPEVGQRVLFKRYEGHIHERGGKTYRLMEDKAVVAIADEPIALERAA